jgi:hypothetical protein
MSTAALKKQVKKAIDRLPVDHLESVRDFVAFLSRPSVEERIEQARKDHKRGKSVPWRGLPCSIVVRMR